MEQTEDKRRRAGQFYTPALFVNEAHKHVTELFGEDWKDNYIVWDCSCGTKNLTRDYNFKELYCSTLFEYELKESEDLNPEGTSFQFDFLNDSLEKLPQGLRVALENNKPIIFFINPPYGTAGNGGANAGCKAGIAKTLINKIMKENKIGMCSSNLYAQFLYRIILIKNQYNLTNCNICIFCPPLYLTGPSWKGLRKKLFDNFNFNFGELFCAAEFTGCKANWGISFSIWKGGKTLDKNNFNHLLIENKNGAINVLGNKIIYNLDNSFQANEWTKENIKGKKTYIAPNLSSGIKISNSERGKLTKDNFGFLLSCCNNIYNNNRLVALFSGATSAASAGGVSIEKDNFDKCCSLFSARRIIKGNWINDKDEYMVPFIFRVRASDWIREGVKDKPKFQAPCLSSGIKISNSEKSKLTKDALGSFYDNANNVKENISGVGLFSSGYSNGRSTSVEKDNFDKCMSLFSAKKLIKCDWRNYQDEYMVPFVEYVSAAEWMKEDIKGKKIYHTPSLSSGLKINKFKDGRMIKDAFGYLLSGCNNVYHNNQTVALFSGSASGTGLGGAPVIPQNFNKCCSLFSARKLIIPNWINDSAEYMKPLIEQILLYNEFQNDAIIYSLFNSASQQSSLRQVDYKGKKWDIKNHFFWMSKDNFNITDDEERFVYKKLQEITLSPEAQAVLDKANKMTLETLKYRDEFNNNHPEYQILNWDCGYYQLKALWKEYIPEEFKEFRELYKTLENKMRPLVYELGFLKK